MGGAGKQIGTDSMTDHNLNVATLKPLSNVVALATAMEDVLSLGGGLPGLVCMYGEAGLGKSKAAAWIANSHRGYYIELKSLWTPKHLLAIALREMGIHPAGTIGAMLDQACEHLASVTHEGMPRPLIIDQADYLIDRGKASLLMDLYEGSQAPLLFLGEERLQAKLKTAENTVHSRVLHWIKAMPCTPDDCRQLAALYAPKLNIADDLLAEINQVCDGITRRVAVNLHRIASDAKVHGWKSVDRAQWHAAKPEAADRYYTGAPRRG